MTVPALLSVLSPAALISLVLPWLGVAASAAVTPVLTGGTTVLVAVLVAIIAVILVAAFGVVAQAERLAHQLGEPYGTLVLTLSVVIIEVVLITSVMMGPGEHASIALDSVTAVMMIILGLVLGVSLIVSGVRHPDARHNRAGTGQYVALIAVFVAISLVLPAFLDSDGAFNAPQALILAVVIAGAYAWFLVRQTGAQAADFDDGAVTLKRATRADAPEIVARAVVLIATMVPIVLLGHTLAAVLDESLLRLDAPAALSGVVIAFIVFTPETITMIRAATRGEAQRVANLGLGAFVSTLGLTIPAVLVIGVITGTPTPLAPAPALLVVIVATVALSAMTYARRRTTATHGALHLVLFAAYLVVLLG